MPSKKTRAAIKPRTPSRAAGATTAKRAPRARPVDEPSTRSAAVPEFRTDGQRLLASVRGSTQLIGDSIGATKQAVSLWRTGARVPDEMLRRKLHTEFRIPPTAWDVAPQSSAENEKSNGGT